MHTDPMGRASVIEVKSVPEDLFAVYLARDSCGPRDCLPNLRARISLEDRDGADK